MPAVALHPSPKKPQGARGLRFLMVISVLAGLGLVAFAVVRAITRQPSMVLLITPRSMTLDRNHAVAIGTLVQDYLECAGNLPVASADEIPPLERMTEFPARTLILVPLLSRLGDDLQVSIHQIWLSDYRKDPNGHWVIGPTYQGLPGKALEQALAPFPGNLPRGSLECLLPRSQEAFWTLIQGQAIHRDGARLPEVQELAAKVCTAEPDCATAWFLQGDSLYGRLLSDPRSQSGLIAEAESHFAKGLALAPNHPRGTFLLAELHIDAGDHRAALELLQGALRQYPKIPVLYSGLAYAARTAGLLDLARRALDRRESLVPAQFSPFTGENTYLYQGDQARFEKSLAVQAGNPRNSVIRFYQGYLTLAHGDRQGAIRHFQAAMQSPEALGQFHQLSLVFAAIAEGRQADALAALHQLERLRVGLRVPDGEFTFKMAEAYALLGQRDAAQDVLSRAFAQGFGCTRWYQESPFLGSLRQMPRWRALVGHIQERQQLMEGRYPAADFGL